MKVAIVLAVTALLAAVQAGKPVNTQCPLKPQAANPSITAEYKGKVIAFCCNNCKGQFNANPDAVAAKIPELKAPAPKTDNKPANTSACEVKKTTKGYYCLKCDRALSADDVRGTECKKCETKPAEIEYCVKRVPFFTSRCQHKKTEDKPFVCCNKPWNIPSGFNEDLGRCTYECDTCKAKTNVPTEIKHKDDCKPAFGGGLKKICTKSGKAPHVGDDK